MLVILHTMSFGMLVVCCTTNPSHMHHSGMHFNRPSRYLESCFVLHEVHTEAEGGQSSTTPEIPGDERLDDLLLLQDFKALMRSKLLGQCHLWIGLCPPATCLLSQCGKDSSKRWKRGMGAILATLSPAGCQPMGWLPSSGGCRAQT